MQGSSFNVALKLNRDTNIFLSLYFIKITNYQGAADIGVHLRLILCALKRKDLRPARGVNLYDSQDYVIDKGQSVHDMAPIRRGPNDLCKSTENSRPALVL